MKKLNILYKYIIITLLLSIAISMGITILYYKLAAVPVYIETFKDDVKVEDCYIIDRDDVNDGYVVLMVYNGQTHTLRGKRNYEKCVAHVNKYVLCDINKAVYRFGNDKIYITSVNESSQLVY